MQINFKVATCHHVVLSNENVLQCSLIQIGHLIGYFVSTFVVSFSTKANVIRMVLS